MHRMEGGYILPCKLVASCTIFDWMWVLMDKGPCSLFIVLRGGSSIYSIRIL